jgi:hypothetical protein
VARARCDGPSACWRAKARIGWIGRAQPRALRAMCRRFCRPNRIACSKSVCDELCPSPTNAARGSRCAQQAPKQGRCTTRVRLQARRRAGSGAELGGSAQGAHCGTALRGGSARRQAAAGLTRACHAAPFGPRKQCAARVEREESARAGRLQDRRHAAGWRSDAPRLPGGQARRPPGGWASAGRARRARRARTRGRRVPIACGTQRGKHARAQSQAHYKQQETRGGEGQGAWNGASSVEFRLSEEFSGGERLKQR